MSRARTIIKFCLVLLIVQSGSCDWKPNNKGKKDTLCNTAECKTRGEEYNKNLNVKVSPCQDFFTFTCGNWQKNHPGPKYTPMWGILDLIHLEFLSTIRKTLESYKYQEGDDASIRQAQAVYETCIRIPEYKNKDAKFIADEVTSISRVPKTSIWDIHTKYLKLTGESSLFRTKILGSKTSGSSPVLMLMEPHSAYGSIFHEENWKPQEEQAYIDFLFHIMKSLNLKDSDAYIRARMEKVLQFRKKLDKISEQNKKKKPDSFKPFVGLSLDMWFIENTPQQTEIQDILWPDVIDALMVNLPAEDRRTRKIIAMRQKQYFLDLMALLKETTEEDLASHMEIYFVERHLKLNENMYKLLEKTTVEPHNLYRYIREKYNARWQTCLEELNLKEGLEKLLYEKWFQKHHAVMVRDIIGRVRTAIERQMEKSTWLDKSTRKETAKKFQDVVEWVGFPPWIAGAGSATVKREKKDILNPEASLALGLNLLYIHAPLLTPPVFSPTIPTVYNYAGIGSTVGHELYHVIDDCGQYVSELESLTWWRPDVREKCLRKKSLFIQMYNKITNMEFKNRYKVDVKSDTTASVLENYPDVMGLEAAYNAYKQLAKSDKSACQTLPNFEDYNCDQMFYIAFANTYCAYYTKKTAEKKLAKKSMHSIDSIRVNGAVAQMKSFATAFGCSATSPMNPQQKVNLWQ